MKKWIPGQIDDSLLADSRVAAGDDNRLAVHSDVGATHTSTKIPRDAYRSVFEREAQGVDIRSPGSHHLPAKANGCCQAYGGRRAHPGPVLHSVSNAVKGEMESYGNVMNLFLLILFVLFTTFT